MPKRVLDFDALWASDKIAACAEWAQAEYAWCYGLADANGSFELTNLRVPWSKVSAIRKNLTIERFEECIDEFRDKGLLFIWTQDGKRYGHWTGSDKPGRLPRESRRTPRYGPIFAPPVPKKELDAYSTECASRRDSKPVARYCDTNPVVGLGVGVGVGLGAGEECASHTSPSAPPVCAETVALWNELCGPMPKVLQLTKTRQKKIQARLKENPEFLDLLRKATVRAAKTPFLCGAGDRGWIASFDWFISNDKNALRVAEGVYENGGSNGTHRGNGKSNGALSALPGKYSDIKPTLVAN